MSEDVALRGSTRAESLATDNRGGARPGSGRKKGGRNLRKGWDAWVKDIQAVTRSEFRRDKLRELAKADAWRYLERIAIPLALRSQPGALPTDNADQLALPLVFVDMGGEAVAAAAKALGDDTQREREADLLGGAQPIEGEVVGRE